MRQVVAERAGGPEVLRLVEVPVPVAGPGEVLVRSEAIGVNFADVWGRLEPAEDGGPRSLGIEVAGTIVATGDGVESRRPGQRVVGVPYERAAAYAEFVVVPAPLTFGVPDGLEAEVAAALPLNYLTAYAAVEHVARPRTGERVLVHAAAGGVGLASVQLARRHGAELYGTASPEKHGTLLEEGVAYPIDYRGSDWLAEVMRLTGDGVDIVIDGVGEEEFRRSLRATRFGGRVVGYGYTSGVTGPTHANLDIAGALKDGVPLYELLEQARGLIGAHLAAPEQWRERWWSDLLAWLDAGEIRPRIDRVLPLAEAAQAHDRLHARRNVGKIVLRP